MVNSNYVNINARIQYTMVKYGYGEHERGYDATKGGEERGPMGK